jgi:hypothetical protein
MRKFLISLILVVAVVAVAACSSSSTNNTTTPSRGNVSVLLTDAPLDLAGVKAVNVTLTDMILYPLEVGGTSGDAGGTEMQLKNVVGGAGLTLNLLDYRNGQTVVIATADVPPGTYSKLRMEIAAAELVRAGATDQDPDLVDPIFVPSGKVDIPVTFTVTAGDATSVTLDFDAAMSVQVNTTQGQHPYILRPVITPAGTSQN